MGAKLISGELLRAESEYYSARTQHRPDPNPICFEGYHSRAHITLLRYGTYLPSNRPDQSVDCTTYTEYSSSCREIKHIRFENVKRLHPWLLLVFGLTPFGAMAAQENLPRLPKNVRFRVLIIGRANAGKTSILQRVCNTTERPVIDVVGSSGTPKRVRSRS